MSSSSVRARHRTRPAAPVPLAVLSAKGRREVEALRIAEARLDAECRLSQYRHNRLALLYVRAVEIDYDMIQCPFRMLHPQKGWLRGREGTIPSRANMTLPLWKAIAVSPACADALIARDGEN